MGRWVSLQMTCLSRGSDSWPGSVLGAPSQLEGVCVVLSSPGWWTVLLLGWGWGGWESPRMWGAERRSRGWETVWACRTELGLVLVDGCPGGSVAGVLGGGGCCFCVRGAHARVVHRLCSFVCEVEVSVSVCTYHVYPMECSQPVTNCLSPLPLLPSLRPRGLSRSRPVCWTWTLTPSHLWRAL